MAPKRIPHSDFEVISGDKKTKDYLKMQKIMGRFYFNDFFSKFDKIKPDGRFLEVGPGPGFQTVLVNQRYSPTEIIGLEYSKDMINVAENYSLQKGTSDKIKFVFGPVEDSELIKSLGKFDIVYSTFSLHHWKDPLTGIKNLYDALKNNGTLFIYDFVRGGLLYYLCLRKGIWESIRASYCKDEIANFLKELNINDSSIRQKGLYLDFILKKN